ncbi:MAG: PEGA domain-containing protein [Calditrichaeota bacterium]|nr:MAG: PEGA domain-containing protein [Calditrichota bacterium]
MKKLLCILTVSMLTVLIGCKGHITVDEAYNALDPVKQLELPDQIQENLVVVIDNVADESSSYKNRIELFINDYPIDPNWLISNVQNRYVYNFRLKPGYYSIHARYYAYVGWGEDQFDLVSEELVRVQHDKRTILSTVIAKKPNGEPVNKITYFKQTREDLSTLNIYSETQEEFKANRQGPGLAEKEITLQINTMPENCQIIVDDQVVGQSPLRTLVNKASGHVLQISAAGYTTKTIYLDSSKFKGKNIYRLVIELDKE